MSIWTPLHCHSHFSLLDGLSKPSQIAARCVELGYTSCAITDHSSVGGVPDFFAQCGKSKIKPIAGCEFNVCRQDSTIRTPENGKYHHLVCLAKNAQGWNNLMRATTAAHRPENSYRKPRLDIEKLAAFANHEVICFSGHMGSELADVCFTEPNLAYGCRTYEEARTLAHPDWAERTKRCIQKHQSLFGAENFFVEIQLVDAHNMPAARIVANILRHVAKNLGCLTIATADSHYCRREDAADQRVLLCSALKTTMKQVRSRMERGDDVALGSFFRSNSYHIPSPEEMEELHAGFPEELANSLLIAERCEEYKFEGAPLLPKFDCPDGKSPDDFLVELCREGWKQKVLPKVVRHKHAKYVSRMKEVEFPVLKEAGLSSYFLIVWDYCRYARSLNAKLGPGRGSAAGCLVSYLLDITRVDPIKADLSFERFYNAGRNSPGKISLPDVDCDFPKRVRGRVIDYCREKYGVERVCQMGTFSRIQGRGALKTVLGVHEKCSQEEMNLITKHIPDESAISDDLQEMAEQSGESSIILWALENNAENLSQWCSIGDDGELTGDFALQFAQAMRLEGTNKNMGRHPSGLVICLDPVDSVCPMVYDPSSELMITGVDMKDAERFRLPKFDILGLSCLDKIETATSLIRGGK